MRAAVAASSRVTRLSAHVAPRRVATRAMSFHALSVRARVEVLRQLLRLSPAALLRARVASTPLPPHR